MEFEATQFDDSLLDPAPEEQDTPVVDEPVAQMGAQKDGDNDFDNQYNEYNNQNQNNTELNAYEQFLLSKGVRDGKTIVYEDEETGETSEVNFTDLTTDEQLRILNELSSPDLTDDELKTISFLRQNGVGIQDVINYYSDQAVKEYIANTQQYNAAPINYKVDEYSNDELYLADLKSRYSDMTDEELLAELESAKENEEMFNRKVDSVRNRFKAIEQENMRIQQAQIAKETEEAYNIINQTIDQFNYVPLDYKNPSAGAMQVENEEKAAIWDYLFNKDAYGMSAFVRDLNDPSRLVEMAWRMLYGADAMADISTYWKSELKKSRRSTEPVKPKNSTTVVKNTSRPQTKSVLDDTNNVTSLNPGWGKLL